MDYPSTEEHEQMVARLWVEIRERAAEAVSIPVAAATVDLYEKPLVLLGLLVDGESAAGAVKLYGAKGQTGPIVCALSVANGALDTEWLGDGGVWCRSGLSAAIIGAPTAAVAFVRFQH